MEIFEGDKVVVTFEDLFPRERKIFRIWDCSMRRNDYHVGSHKNSQARPLVQKCFCSTGYLFGTIGQSITTWNFGSSDDFLWFIYCMSGGISKLCDQRDNGCRIRQAPSQKETSTHSFRPGEKILGFFSVDRLVVVIVVSSLNR